MTKTVEEVRKERANLIRAYEHVLNGPDAELVMDDLASRFNGSTLRAIDKVIDPYASIAAAGAREPYLYMDAMRKTNAPSE
jgi:hypothetical protein